GDTGDTGVSGTLAFLVCVSCPREGLSRFRGHAIWKVRNPDLAAYSRRFVLPLLPLMLFAVGLAWWGFGPDGVLPEGPVASPSGTNPIEIRPALEDGRRAAGLSLEFRRQVWGLAGEMVQDFPFTGIGLGTFPRVAEVLYGSALLYGPEVELPHAHNLVLQVAVDLGLPGLGFFTLLTACGTLAAHRAIAGAPSAPIRALAAGAAGGLLAYYLYGITDAIGLGEKPGLVYWILLAIVGACARLAVPRDAVPRGSISSSVEPVRSSAS
ncbi:MAG: O-antigen ligase family protein, partial [Chloroflexota bacterium]|nr:O-antigen ligase family protein [Chloroflexota bacterium]